MIKNILICILIMLLGLTVVFDVRTSGHFSEINFYLYSIKDGNKHDKAWGLARLYYQYDLGDKLNNYERAGDKISDYARLAALLLIQSLKDETGDDLGDDPQAWIDKYYPKKANTSSEGSE